MNEIRPPGRRSAKPQPELAPAGTPLHIAVAPGVLDRQHVVVRDEDDTDESYQSRCELVALMLDCAAKQG